jgi:hypothetical protein
MSWQNPDTGHVSPHVSAFSSTLKLLLFVTLAGAVLRGGPIANEAAEVITGSLLPQVVIQFILFLAIMLMAMRLIIMERIGSLSAVVIVSRFRLLVGILVCAAFSVATYHALLLIRPLDSNRKLWTYVLVSIVSYPVYGLVVSLLSLAADHGRALQVITSRYKPPQRSWFIDLTEKRGRHSQLIARGAIRAFQLLVILGFVAAVVKLRAEGARIFGAFTLRDQSPGMSSPEIIGTAVVFLASIVVNSLLNNRGTYMQWNKSRLGVFSFILFMATLYLGYRFFGWWGAIGAFILQTIGMIVLAVPLGKRVAS